MKKFTQLAAGVMALTLAAGIGVSAASPSTTNTRVENAEPSAPAVDYIVYRDSTNSVTRAAAVKTGDTVVRVSSDYSGITDPQAIATVIAPDQATRDALLSYINAAEPGKTVVGPVKIQVYNRGKALTGDFGTFQAVIGVGAKYNGRSVTAYIYHQDGTVETLTLAVVNGRVAVPMTSVGSVALVF